MVSEITDKIAKLAIVIIHKIPRITTDFRAPVNCKAIRLSQRREQQQNDHEFLSISSPFFIDTEPRLRIYSDIRRGLSCRESLNSRHADDESFIPEEVKGGGRGDGILAGSLRFAGINSHHTSAWYPVICHNVTPGDGNRYHVFSTRSRLMYPHASIYGILEIVARPRMTRRS